MKMFGKVVVAAACALLAFSAVSCANNSNGGKGDLSGSNAMFTSTNEYRYTYNPDDGSGNTLLRFFFTSGSTWELKTTENNTTILEGKGTYSTNGSTVSFTRTWAKDATASARYGDTFTGTLSSDKKTLVVDGVTFTKQ